MLISINPKYNKKSFIFLLLVSLLWLMGCEKSQKEQNVEQLSPAISADPFVRQPDTHRWYTDSMRVKGDILYQKYCAVCHGENAESTPNWKTPTASGHYPPPPLNGTAHAWHHPLSVLELVIAQGGAPMGGVMPGWEGVLSREEILMSIASFQHHWPDNIYDRWLEIQRQ